MHGARILVVGAGLAGLALARALGRAGFAPELIEREAGWEAAGTGMYLPANGVRALGALGLEEAVAARAAPITHQRLLDHHGRLLAEIDLDGLWGDVGACLALPRADLHQVLREGVAVRMGRTIASLEHLDGPVRGDLRRRPARAATTWSSGPTGCARRSGGWPSTPARRSRSASTAGGSWPPAHPQVTTWTVMLGRGASFLTIPIGGGLVYCYADVTTDPDSAGPPAGDPLAGLRERFAGFAAPVPQLLDQLPRPGPGACGPDRAGRRRTLGPGGGGAGRRRRPRHVAQHGPGRRPGLRGRPGPGRLPGARPARSPTRWPGSWPAATRGPAGSAPRPTAATRPGTCRRSCATRSCGSSAGASSGRTTSRFWPTPDRHRPNRPVIRPP